MIGTRKAGNTSVTGAVRYTRSAGLAEGGCLHISLADAYGSRSINPGSVFIKSL